MDNQILSSNIFNLSSTIFNRANKKKLYSEYRQQGIQLQNFITCNLLNQNSCLNYLCKEEGIYYKIFHIGNNRFGLEIYLQHIVKLKVLTEQMFRLNPTPNG
jgi:hypothetical protein